MSRPIDGDKLIASLKANRLRILSECENDGAAVFDEVMEWIQLEPTLTHCCWVSVEERLPSNMDDVIVVVRDKGECWTVTGYYSSMSKKWYAALNGQDTQMDVLFWMPLPVPPTKEKNNT